MLTFLYLWILIVKFLPDVLASCTLPSQFQNSVWVDSDKEDLTFDTVSMTGWDIQAAGSTYEDWECFHTSTTGTKLYLIMRNAQNFTLHGDTFTPYLCMELTEISTASYYYYLLWAEEDKYDYERISTTFSTTTVSDPVQELCFDINNPTYAALYPETGEYHVLVKKGNELEAKQECPSTFFGEYSYTVTDIEASTNYCGTGNEVWDVCTDYEKMTFNYTICDTEITYSGNGSVFCIASITSGSYTYHTVYNEDNTVDASSDTYRFACLVSSIASDGSLSVSQTPGSCKKGQTPNDQPVLASDGSTAGLNLQLTPRRLCPKTNESSSGLSTGVIIGIVFGALILIAVIVLVCLLCIRCKGRQPKEKKETADKSPVSSPRSERLSVDIDDIPHQRSPHWIHGPHGTAPMETKFSGEHKISKSPTLDHEYNPFSVLPLGKGKENRREEVSNGIILQSPTEICEREKASKESQEVQKQAEGKKREKEEMTTSTKNVHSEKLFIEDLERANNNYIIPARPGAYTDKESNHLDTRSKPLPENTAPDSFQLFHVNDNGTVSRNSNITPKAIVLETKGFNNNTSNALERRSPVKDTNEKKIKRINTSEGKHEGVDNEVSVLSRSSYRHNIQGNQRREASLTPILVTEEIPKTESPKQIISSKTPVKQTENSLQDTSKIIKSNFRKEDSKYARSFPQVPSRTPPPGPNDERSFKNRTKNKVTTKSKSSVTKKEKHKKGQPPKQTFKPKSKSNKRGQQALNSLIRSKSVGVSKNKKGAFYNEVIPTIGEPETYLNISELNDTDPGICYDEDNEKARALGYWNDSLVTNVTHKSEYPNQRNLNELKLALDTTDSRSISRLTSSTGISGRGSVSIRSVSAITSRIDSRGAKYFIENEASSIAIHVKASDVPDNLGAIDFVGGTIVDNVETNDAVESEKDEDEDEDEYEDEEEDGDYDEENESIQDTVETTMSVLYGTPNKDGEDEDPDRMVLSGYEPDLLTIKE